MILRGKDGYLRTAALTKESCVLVPHDPVIAPVAPFQMVKGISTTCMWNLIVLLVCKALVLFFSAPLRTGRDFEKLKRKSSYSVIEDVGY
jgi:hypothetical protein